MQKSGFLRWQENSSPSLPIEQEKEIIGRAQKGDGAAFQLLYQKYKDRVYTIAYYSLKNEALAEDATQTIFVKVFQALPSFRFESSFMTWLYQVAINECRNQRRNRIPFEPLQMEQPDPRPSPDAIQDSIQTNRALRRAVLGLTLKLRTVVVLKYVEDLSYEEIAAVLKCSTGTVASRLHRAIQELHRKITKVYPQEP